MLTTVTRVRQPAKGLQLAFLSDTDAASSGTRRLLKTLRERGVDGVVHHGNFWCVCQGSGCECVALAMSAP